ncbi:18 kDa heat shock protein [bacterium BMS3Abin03]|nr:18 kDa heat shock protein [bacterium BMS3Abin03]
MTDKKEIVPVRDLQNKSIEDLLETQNYISPEVNIYENDTEFVLIADMPGVSRDRIKVKIDEDSLIMFGQIDYANEINRDYILNEREIGNYYRLFKISDSVDRGKIEAKFDNGQLVVTLPKQDKIKPRTIDIN